MFSTLNLFPEPLLTLSQAATAGSSFAGWSGACTWIRACDILMVSTPGGPQTKNLIDAKILDALGPNGILVNIARGTVAIAKRYSGDAGAKLLADQGYVPEMIQEMGGAGTRGIARAMSRLPDAFTVVGGGVMPVMMGTWSFSISFCTSWVATSGFS